MFDLSTEEENGGRSDGDETPSQEKAYPLSCYSFWGWHRDGDVHTDIRLDASPLGPVAGWPSSLRMAVSLGLNSQFPTVIFWGPDLVMLYNDAYLPMLADKHPASLGQAARECWPEIWSIIGPMLHGVLETGQATWSYDLLLPIIHEGAVGEYYFTFSYSPIYDEAGMCAASSVQ